MKYLYIDSTTRVSYDKDNYYLNGTPMPNETVESVVKLAKELSLSKASECIKNYSSAFKNIAILTAAGTSIDNGENPGKTRVELWDYCAKEINAISKKLKNKGKTLNAIL